MGHCVRIRNKLFSTRMDVAHIVITTTFSKSYMNLSNKRTCYTTRSFEWNIVVYNSFG